MKDGSVCGVYIVTQCNEVIGGWNIMPLSSDSRVIRVTMHRGYGWGDKIWQLLSGEGRKHAFTVISLALKMEAPYL